MKEITFALAAIAGSPVGCGALRLLDSHTVELKRFYVDSSLRGRGIATPLLSFLEDLAKEQGYHTIVLETGPRQPEAIGLYRKFGYRQIEAFGEYAGCEFSLCMEKHIVSSSFSERLIVAVTLVYH